MTDSERKQLEKYLEKLKSVERPDISVKTQIHMIEEKLKQK